ncbi:MAG: hypothetical protein CME65_01260 [Halobacteriovoraceae bacterium]|nr:hypothetical protein [Halobacteriovoraceae bacterium]|tara:strand:- start:1114 stop:3021 length:1908 start_codon:yes stop_codon:yes gene_type:complete
MKWMCCIFILISSCSSEKNRVVLIKQWHLTPQTKTLNIEKAMQIPQFENQKDIYLKLVKLKQENKLDLVIAEGCEGELSENFDEIYNGWNLKSLKANLKSSQYENILAPIPMKLKARFSKLKVLCGDNLNLVKKHLKSASDMRGFFGFYQKLTELKQVGDEERFSLYQRKLKEVYPDLGPDHDPIKFSKSGVINSLGEFERLLKERNKNFEKIILENIERDPVVIIGGLHVEDLKQRLENKSIEVEVIVPAGYRDDELSLLQKFKDFFKEETSKWTGFMLPENFRLSKFDFSHQIVPQVMMTKSEREQLQSLAIKAELDESILYSDFDQDGIRDFTLSEGANKIILAPEDADWDNDGVLNLEDSTLGKIKIAEFRGSVPLANNYISQVSPGELVKQLKANLKFVQEDGYYHEVLVLEVLKQLIQKLSLPLKNIIFLRAASLNISKGDNNFFNYVKGVKTLNYDPKKLLSFVNSQRQRNFKGAQYKNFINSYLVPLLIHSLSHEVAHSLPYDYSALAEQMDWKTESGSIKSLYLKAAREEELRRTTFIESASFRGKTYKQWRELATKSNDPLFIEKEKLLSLYSTLNPSEWFAELYSLCVFQKVYPKSTKTSESKRWIQLLGINPAAATPEICLSF